MVGVPIGWTGTHGGFVSVDEPRWWRRGWLRVEAQDHLSREDFADGLEPKLHRYLRSQVRVPPSLFCLHSPQAISLNEAAVAAA